MNLDLPIVTAPRRAAPADLAHLPDMERRAAQRFATVNLPAVANGPTLPQALLRKQQEQGLVWVAGDPPLGFAVAFAFPHSLHLHEVSVEPYARGRGVGRALVEAVVSEAGKRGFPEVTLITFENVPWNAPWYRRLGFREAPEAAERDETRRLRDRERGEGLDDLGLRVVMARSVDPT